MKPTIHLASDHAGFSMKNELLAHIRDVLGYQVVDHGAYAYDEDDDYTEFIAKAAREVSVAPQTNRAVILGGSGQGEAMLANRFHDVRAAVYYGGDVTILTLSREHNDANVLSLGARFIDAIDAKEAVRLWLGTEHTVNERYDRRIADMDTLSLPLGTLSTETKFSLVPSLPAASYEDLTRLMTALEGTAAGIQIDMVDGTFAPSVSWPFTEAAPGNAILSLSAYAKRFVLEADCMCVEPEQYLDILVQAGFARIVIHMESTDVYSRIIEHKNEHGYMLGFAILNDTPLQLLSPYVEDIDFVQVMGIREIGKQGEPFDERTLDTVKRLREMYPQLEIAIDGSVNTATLPLLKAAGANRFAPGSAIAKAEDPKRAYEQLLSMMLS